MDSGEEAMAQEGEMSESRPGAAQRAGEGEPVTNPDAKLEVDEDEGQVQRAAKAPRLPGAREREEHNLTHCPYRSWCEHCVKGQAKDFPHRTVSGSLAESDVVRVSMDYCFLTEDVVSKDVEHETSTKSRVSMTVLVMAETLCRSVWAYAVTTKGAGEAWVAEQIVEDLETVGLSQERIIVKADQEASITDVQRAVVQARSGLGTALEQSRVGDSNSNGRVERAIQDLKGLTRTLRSALESDVGGKISLDHPIVPWMVRHAGHLITTSRVRDGGRTAYQLMKGRRSNAKLVPFGESVLFKIPKTANRVGEFEDRWETGAWLGFVMRSGEHLVGTDKGVFKVSAIMRRLSDKRWSRDLIDNLVGAPEEPVPGSGTRRLQAHAKKFQDDASGTPVYFPLAEPEQEVRAAHITK